MKKTTPNILKAFKGIDGTPVNPANPYEQGTAYFRHGHTGEAVQHHMEELAEKTEVGRRDFFRSACGFAGAMLAVNAATGMKFFNVSDAEAREVAATAEVKSFLKGNMGPVVDQHTHICTRAEGYVRGVNTTDAGMYFVVLVSF